MEPSSQWPAALPTAPAGRAAPPPVAPHRARREAAALERDALEPAALDPDAFEPATLDPDALEPADAFGPDDDGRGATRRPSWLRRRLGPALAALVAVLVKLKSILLLLPKIKLLASAGTMFVSLAAYAVLFGWEFAAGIIALLFVHEMGHVIALRREGIKASAPMFIPFMGALIAARSLGDNALAEARVGLAGPVLGSVGAAVTVGLWQATGDDLFRALAYFGFFINLFNLIPVIPLDGGRAMAAMAPWMWFVGFVGLIPLLFVLHSPILLIILVFAAHQTWVRWRRLRSSEARESAYYRVRRVDRLLVAAVYLALVALLVVGMQATYVPASLS